MTKFFTNNRKKIVKDMDENTLLIMFAGQETPNRGDELYSFVPKRNFYYLTGIDKPKIILTIYKKLGGETIETLYIERFDEVLAKWVGAVLSEEEAQIISGIEKIAYIDNFESTISKTIFSNSITKLYFDLENRHWNNVSEDICFANKIKAQCPNVIIENAYLLIGNHRVIKSKKEVALIQKAIDITGEGLSLMLKNLKPNMMEYELEAYFDYTLTKNGVRRKAFATIAGSGKNATILHYDTNSSRMSDGDLVLLDLGASCGYYSGDITRTYPVNGKFTPRQKQLYNIVLGGQKKVIAAIKPGLLFSKLNEILIDYYVKELKKINLITNKEELSKYYFHGVSHFLGLETHDIGRGAEGEIKKGMVFTVEPGLYISEESIGIRIEDDILVTEKGCEILSSSIIKEADEIEAAMSRSNIDMEPLEF